MQTERRVSCPQFSSSRGRWLSGCTTSGASSATTTDFMYFGVGILESAACNFTPEALNKVWNDDIVRDTKTKVCYFSEIRIF